MPDKIFTVTIVGAGQLGARYLQGLIKCSNKLRIFVYDISTDSLMKANSFWKEAGGLEASENILFTNDINDLPREINLAIISTIANVRPDIIRKISQKHVVESWILEKVLAQDLEGLALIKKSIGNYSNAWVNTPRRALEWHQKIRQKIPNNIPISMTVTGNGWGLACNAIHFLDLMVWWTGEKLVEISTDLLDDDWFPAKRPGNFEINGILSAKFSEGSKITLSSSIGDGNPNYIILLSYGDISWTVDEQKGLANSSSGFNIPGCLPFQSEMTPLLVDEILSTNNCELTKLEESIEIHSVLISGLLYHWQNHVNSAAKSILIT